MSHVSDTSRSFRAFCEELVNDPAYRLRLRIQMREGTIDSRLEQLIVHYAAGKPTEQVDVRFPDGVPKLNEMTNEQLAERAEKLAQTLRAAQTGAMAGSES